MHDSIQTVLRERKQYENSLVWNVHLEQNLATDGNAKRNLDKFNEVYPSRLLDAQIRLTVAGLTDVLRFWLTFEFVSDNFKIIY